MQQQNLPISKITMQANFSKLGQIYEATKKTCAGVPVQLTAWLALAGEKKIYGAMSTELYTAPPGRQQPEQHTCNTHTHMAEGHILL